MAKDIICGMYVDEAKSPFKTKQDGVDYFFCSQNCLNEFQKPEKELAKLKIVTIISLVLGAITAIFEYVWMIDPFGIPNFIFLFILATPVQFMGGWRFYLGTLDAIRARTANMDSLIALGTSAAWFYSTLVAFQGILWDRFLPLSHVYFTESGLIIGFILLGKYLEHKVKGKASQAIRKLLDLQPKLATVVRGGKTMQIPVEQLKVGDIFLVKPGEKIAVDGIVVEGVSHVDQSMITGESVPVKRIKGDEVIGATINKSGLLKIKATKVGSDTTLSHIVRMVQEAVVTRAPMQRLADLISAYFVPAVIAIAVLSFIFWYYIMGMEFPLAFTIFISVLIVACPCALGIATPAAIMIGASKGAQNGILIKNGEYLEKARKINAIVFDKTGTLTKGEPSVTDIIAFGMSKGEVLKLAAIAEKGSEHPIGDAILKKAKDLKVPNVKKYQTVSGKGIKVSYAGKALAVGNRKLAADLKVSMSNSEKEMQRLENQAKTVVLVMYGGKLVGLIAVADTLKEHSKAAITKLKDMRIEILMITGDNERTAKAIARQVGIDRVLANVLPGDKASEIKKLQKEGRIVAMVGDGINDAPALAQADVGIAIGAGTDIAKETGGIVLIKNDIRDVAIAIDLSKKTVRKMKENLFWAFIYNIALIPIAAGVLYPMGILFNPIFAAIAMATSSITVVGNSMLLNNYKPKL